MNVCLHQTVCIINVKLNLISAQIQEVFNCCSTVHFDNYEIFLSNECTIY
jgi:hypothetical protein